MSGSTNNHKQDTGVFSESYKQRILRHQEGQVLLLIVLFITLLLTVVMAMSFRTSRDIQLTQVEAETVSLKNAAEIGVEQAIVKSIEPGKSVTFEELDLKEEDLNMIDVKDSTVTVEKRQLSEIRSPDLQKDEQHTFFLADYVVSSDNVVNFGSSYTGDLEIEYLNKGLGGCRDVSLELTVVYRDGSDYKLQRYISDAGKIITRDNPNVLYNLYEGTSDANSKYNCKASTAGTGFDSIPEKKMLIGRVFFSVNAPTVSTPIIIRPSGTATVLPSQGIHYRAEAISKAGVKREAKLFRSYPQIPADLFVTSF